MKMKKCCKWINNHNCIDIVTKEDIKHIKWSQSNGGGWGEFWKGVKTGDLYIWMGEESNVYHVPFKYCFSCGTKAEVE